MSKITPHSHQENHCEINEKIIREREVGISKIAQQVNEISEIFIELNNIIVSQGETINNQINPSLEKSLVTTKKALSCLKKVK